MFPAKINDYIISHSLIEAEDRVIVGLSGGADSVALLLVLRELGVRCVATHCNFHLRGDESNRDEAFCRELTSSLGVPIYVKDFDVPERQSSTRESVEMACRSLRYQWWKELIDDGIGTLLAVGHHREDNIETFFLNLLRGSGLRGLKGMLPKNGEIIRPLLDVSRREIEEYLTDRKTSFITDSTNLEESFKRNRLRLNLIPYIDQIFPGAADAISHSVDHLRDNFLLYQDYIRLLREHHTDSEGRLNLAAVVKDSPAAEAAVLELIRPYGLNSTHAHDITVSIRNGTSGSKRFGSCLLDRGILYPPVEPEYKESVLDISFISPEEFREIIGNKMIDRNALYVDADEADPDAFTIRNWQSGDRIAPFGMKGTRLVSDILSDAKLSAREKEEVKIVESAGKIVWVAGIRASRHYPVTASTRNVAVIKLRKEDKNLSDTNRNSSQH